MEETGRKMGPNRAPKKLEIGLKMGKQIFEGKRKGEKFGRKYRMARLGSISRVFPNDFIFLINCQCHARKGRT